MRDPFRPNNNTQLVREAQIAFVVIGLLLCVMVYVAFHRMTGRQMHFRQLAQGVPPAEHVDDTRYVAQAMIEKEAKIVDDTVDAIREAAAPKSITTEDSQITPRGFEPSQQPRPLAAFETSKPPEVQTPAVVETLPVEEAVVAATVPLVPVPAPTVAQANFNGPVDSGPLKKDLKKINAASDDNPFTMITSDRPTPEIRSDFGAGSIRELPSFDRAAKEKLDAKLELKPVPKFKAAPVKPLQLEPVAKKNTPRSFNPQPLRSSAFNAKTQIPQPSSQALSNSTPANSTPAKPTPAKDFVNVTESKATKVNSQPKFSDLSDEKNQQYETKVGDSLWSIANEHYGDGRFFRALHKHNLNTIPSADRLPSGTTLEIPEVEELLYRYSDLCPSDIKRSARAGNSDASSSGSENEVSDYDLYEARLNDRFHLTQTGDTLFGIARQRLGQASRYLEIYELNRFRIPDDVDHLTPLPAGLRLVLPE